jgi:hypothetical protein
MRQYKTIGRILLILPIINLAFALPIAVRETLQVGGVVPDAAITMAKRVDKMEVLWGMNFERVSGKPDSDLEGLKSLVHYVPELKKSPSFDHYLPPPPPTALTKSPSFDYLLEQPKQSESPPSGHSVVSTDSEAGPSRTAASQSGLWMPISPTGKRKSDSILSKVVSKFKLWRRISGPNSVMDAMNVAQRRLQGLVDTGTYVSASSPGPSHKRSNFI